jgi:hypothetical protein
MSYPFLHLDLFLHVLGYTDFTNQADVRRPSGDSSSIISSVPFAPAAAPTPKKSTAALLFGSDEDDAPSSVPASSDFDPFAAPSSSHNVAPISQPASDGLDHSNFVTSFDAFGSPTAARASGTTSFASGFDEFTPTAASHSAAKPSNAFDPFASSSAPHQQTTSINNRGSFGAFASDEFDSFAPSSSQQETSKPDTFTAQSSFDLFSSSAPAKPVAQAKPAPVASAPVDLFNFDSVVSADTILTPTPLAPAPAPQSHGSQGFDLLDTNFTQSYSNKPTNSMDLLSLYDQPKPEAGVMSGNPKPAMRNSSILISNIAVPGVPNPSHGPMGAPAGYSMNSNNNGGINSLDSIPLPGMPASGPSNRRQSYMGVNAGTPYQAMPPSYAANSYSNYSMASAPSTSTYQPKPVTNQRASIASSNATPANTASPSSTMKYYDNPLKKSPKSGGGAGAGGADPFGSLNVFSNN